MAPVQDSQTPLTTDKYQVEHQAPVDETQDRTPLRCSKLNQTIDLALKCYQWGQFLFQNRHMRMHELRQTHYIYQVN